MSWREEKPFCPECGSRAYKRSKMSEKYICKICGFCGVAKEFDWKEAIDL